MIQSNEVSDEMLMALADGELNEIDTMRLHRVIAVDPGVAARFDAFVRTRQMLQDAYPAEAVPGHLIAAVMDDSKIVPLRRPLIQRAGWAAALAASIVLALGGFLAGRSASPAPAGQIDLAQVTAGLITGEEAVLPGGSAVRVLASYETDQGLCRLIDHDDARHVLCRDPAAATWTTAMRVTTGGDSAFLPASDISVVLVDSLLDELGAGAALEPDAERAAMAR